NCNASFVAAFPTSVPVGYMIAATATDIAKNTSEFSACTTVGLQPTLGIRRSQNHEISLSWTNTATGFVLKETASLSPPIQWNTATTTPVMNNGQFVVTLPIGL